MNECAKVDPAERIPIRLTALRETDVASYQALMEVIPALSEHLVDETGIGAVADLVTQVATETPEAAYALVRRLGSQPSLAGHTMGLRRWVLHGLQRHRHDPIRSVHHFEWSDPLVFSDRTTQSDTETLLSDRDALLHYLAGYGVEGYSLELLEPQAAKNASPPPAVHDRIIRFPRRFDGIAPEYRRYFFRAVIAHMAAHVLFSPLQRSAGNRRPTLVALTALIEDARVERLMILRHPGLHPLWDMFHVATKDLAGFDFSGLTARLARALHDADYSDPNPWVNKGVELFAEAAASGLEDVSAFERIARTLALDVGKMRLSVPVDYRFGPVYRDDNVILWSPDLALPQDEARRTEIADFEIGTREEKPEGVDLAGLDARRRFRYPEWDHRLEAVRDDWTTVLEDLRPRRRSSRAMTAGPPSMITIPRSQRTPDRSIRLTRLPEGDDLELNAVIENTVQRRARLSPDGRIFCRHGRRHRSTAIILLMDLSASTDRFVPGSFTKVLELEKEAARVVVGALDPRRDRIAVHGFASNGRHEVNYQRVKDFDEPFDGPQQSRLAALRSRLSTRIGAAIRHATATLAEEDADHKVVLVLTDGEPSDIDVSEEDYLVEDAREAVISAGANRIRTFCLTVDRRADRYVRRIFGSRNYLITERASSFTDNTSKTLMRLLAP